MPNFIVADGHQLHHNGRLYQEGHTIEATEQQAAPLLERGILKAPEVKPTKGKAKAEE